MQIILVSRHLKAARTFTIMPWHVVATLLVFLALVFSTSALFSWLSVHLRLPLIEDLLVKLQLQESQKTRNYLDNNLQLMATRLGELQGQVLQLDALGDRVSGLAGIKREASVGIVKPSQGGPYLPAPTSPSDLALMRRIDELRRVAGAVEAVLVEGGRGLLGRAQPAEQAALKADKRISNTEGGSFNSHYGIKVFGNSHGMLQGYCSTRHSLSSCVIAEENGDMERDYAYTIGRALGDLQSPEWVGKECAERTLSRLSPRKLSTMKAPVIFANEVATGLFGHLVGAIAGGSVYRKSTFLLDSLGKQILPEWLTIEEHPHLLKGLASTPFDSEGVRTERRDIIKDGVLTQWLLTNYSARKLGLKSTGHAGGIHNWRINGRGLSFAKLLKEMGTGLVVTELMGQGVSGVTGDYSRGASGFWVENGEIQYPVSEITIAGNLKDMWRNIVTIGDDIETRSNIQCGSVLLPEMKIAGQ